MDLFVLDIEGAEMAVLETIPFHELNIKHIYIETDKAPKERVKDILFKNNYTITKEFYINTLFSRRA